ncbi:MAG: DUF3828 domain-containing protein [Rhodomicrobium sp.]
MKRRIGLAACLLMASLAAAFAGESNPSAFVASLYGKTASSGHHEEPLSIFIAEARDLYLSKRLRAALAEMDKRTPQGDAPDLDFDPVTAGNDPDVRDLKVKTETESAGRAEIVADFLSHDDTERTVLHYSLVREDGGWKVDDIAMSGEVSWRVSEIVRGH